MAFDSSSSPAGGTTASLSSATCERPVLPQEASEASASAMACSAKAAAASGPAKARSRRARPTISSQVQRLATLLSSVSSSASGSSLMAMASSSACESPPPPGAASSWEASSASTGGAGSSSQSLSTTHSASKVLWGSPVSAVLATSDDSDSAGFIDRPSTTAVPSNVAASFAAAALWPFGGPNARLRRIERKEWPIGEWSPCVCSSAMWASCSLAAQDMIAAGSLWSGAGRTQALMALRVA
mmetsp:Transcript_125547/g.360934  ORF Transcript_125547/g.360934 Transcript_125547/m.360934 type:complete len:242 (-) Transcript_125547:8-733(-)